MGAGHEEDFRAVHKSSCPQGNQGRKSRLNWSSFFRVFFFFLTWSIFKVFFETVTILLLFYLAFWLSSMWDLSTLTKYLTNTPSLEGKVLTTGPLGKFRTNYHLKRCGRPLARCVPWNQGHFFSSCLQLPRMTKRLN